MKQENNFWFCVLSALAIVGAIVGVGFVSGKEIVSFFFRFEGLGFLLAGIACLLLFFCVIFAPGLCCFENDQKYKKRKNVMKRCKNIDQNGEILENDAKNKNLVKSANCDFFCGKSVQNCGKLRAKSAIFFERIVGVFQVVISGCMIAGVRELLGMCLNENVMMKNALFVLVILVVFVLIFCFGEHILKISGAVTLALILVMVATICIGFFGVDQSDVIYIFDGSKSNFFGGVWLAIFYVSMNMLSCSGIVQSIKLKVKSKKQVIFIAGLASLVLFFMIFLILTIYMIYPELANESMPLLVFAGRVGEFLRSLYFSVLFLGAVIALVCVCFSSLVSFGVTKSGGSFLSKVVFVLLCSVLISFVGFDFLIENVYPILGFLYLLIAFLKLIIKQKPQNE